MRNVYRVLLVAFFLGVPGLAEADGMVKIRVLTVRGDDSDWTPAGLTVGEQDLIVGTAKGTVKFGWGATAGPDATGSGGLEMRVGRKVTIQAGKAWSYTGGAGEVKLRVRDNKHDDNSGFFEVKLIVVPASVLAAAECQQQTTDGNFSLCPGSQSSAAPTPPSTVVTTPVAVGVAPPAAAANEERTPTGRIQVSKKHAFQDTSVTPDIVLAKIQSAYIAGIRRCYLERLRKDATARGEITVSFTVNQSGRTTRPATKGFASDVDDCMRGQVSSWRFPVPKNKDGNPVDASFSITLQAVPD